MCLDEFSVGATDGGGTRGGDQEVGGTFACDTLGSVFDDGVDRSLEWDKVTDADGEDWEGDNDVGRRFCVAPLTEEIMGSLAARFGRTCISGQGGLEELP